MKIIKSNSDLFNYINIFRSKLNEEKTLFISMAGLSRSGKSTLLIDLQNRFHKESISSKIISLDYWIIPASKRNDSMTVKDRYQYDKISADISEITNNKEIKISPYNPLTREVSGEVNLSIKNIKVVFFDGVIALDHSFLHEISHLKIYVEIDEELRKSRFYDFYRSKGLSDSKISLLYGQRMIDENNLVLKSKSTANILFNYYE